MCAQLLQYCYYFPQSLFELFLHACERLFFQPLCTHSPFHQDRWVFFYIMLFKVRRQQEQTLNNILPVLLKNQLLYILHTHSSCIKCKFYSYLISSAFIMLSIAAAPKHFMLFPLTIIYHLIIRKCFLQSKNFINNPFSRSLFFSTLAYKSIKHLSCIR